MYVLVEAKSVTPFASSPLMSPLVHWRPTSSFPTCWDSSGPHGSTPYYLNEVFSLIFRLLCQFRWQRFRHYWMSVIALRDSKQHITRKIIILNNIIFQIGNFLKWKVPQTASQLGAGWMLDARKRKTVRSSAFVPMIWARKYLVKHVLEMLVSEFWCLYSDENLKSIKSLSVPLDCRKGMKLDLCMHFHFHSLKAASFNCISSGLDLYPQGDVNQRLGQCF